MENKTKFYERLKNDIAFETNRLRTNPKYYIPILENYLYCFNDNILTKPDTNEYIETIEGAKAYKEAIEFLKAQRPMEPLILDEEASKIGDECIKLINSNKNENNMSDNDYNLEERVNKYITWDIDFSESIDYGGNSSQDIIINLLVDDGIYERTHRNSLFNNKYKFIGISVGFHPDYEICSVMDYIGDIIEYKNKQKRVMKDAPKKIEEKTKIDESKKAIT